ncbi:MAG: PIG-L family deacetylase [Lentisphaerae bacterium]|nr:PIG-L family deacetylase [Lentisphaerota bacterium]
MKLHKPNADILVPDGADLNAALARTTHLGVGAHQDDLEVFALHGIFECFGQRDKWFTAVTCTDGRGSARTGVYANYTDDEMTAVRIQEQRVAACIGRYSAALQLMYSSAESKNPATAGLTEDLLEILKATRPKVIYSHNPADKHATHVAVFSALLAALRRLPADARPEKFYGVEVWRNLDWMADNRKIVLDVSGREHLADALMGVYDSQIAGGKRYDLAVAGRRVANATMFDSHSIDATTSTNFAMDLMPLIRDDRLEVATYVGGLIEEFRTAVMQQWQALKRG